VPFVTPVKIRAFKDFWTGFALFWFFLLQYGANDSNPNMIRSQASHKSDQNEGHGTTGSIDCNGLFGYILSNTEKRTPAGKL
jgi:hypothetical protein